MKLIKKYLKGSKTPIKDAVKRGWDNIKNLSVRQQSLPIITGSTTPLGNQVYNSTIKDEAKIAASAPATIVAPIAGQFVVNYPIRTALGFLYGLVGDVVGNKVGKTLGKGIDYFTNNHIGSELGGYLGSILGGGYFGGPLAENAEKRAVEIAMRKTIAANPIPDIMYGLKQSSGKQKLSLLNYILTGKRPKGIFWEGDPFDTYSHTDYSGFLGLQKGQGNDLIDAYLYRKEIDPSYGFKLTPEAEHPYTDYIMKKYRDKVDKIPIYTAEMKNPEYILNDYEITPKTKPSWESIDDNGGFFEYVPSQPNVSGHLLYADAHIIDEGDTYKTIELVLLEADIWKFNLSDYYNRYFKDPDFLKEPLTRLQSLINKIGLREVDRLGTPVILLTPRVKNTYSVYKNPYKYSGPKKAPDILDDLDEY